MCKAHSKVTHIKQQKYFHHLKGRGYNKNSVLLSRALEVMKIFLLFYMCDFAMGLTHCYKTTVFFTFILAIDRWLVESEQHCGRPPCSLQHTPPRISESLFITTSMDDHDDQNRAEQNLFVRSGKFEAEVTNNRRLRSTYCTIEANYWQRRSIARPLCNSRTTSFHATGK